MKDRGLGDTIARATKATGINGMQIKKYPCKSYDLNPPITQRAKQ